VTRYAHGYSAGAVLYFLEHRFHTGSILGNGEAVTPGRRAP
jgi:hypothetical protein